MRKEKISKFQEQFWLLNNLAKASPAYNIPNIFKLDKKPDIIILQDTINELTNRYEQLRTSFNMENNEVFQFINSKDSIKIEIEEIELSKYSDNKLNKLPIEIYDEVHKPFNLNKAPLLRVKLFNFNDTLFLTIVFHHIIVDLHSKDVFAKELSLIYNSKITGKNYRLPLLPEQYTDFSKLHNNWIVSEDAKKMKDLWQQALPEPNTLLNLPLDFDRPLLPALNGKRNYFVLDESLSYKLCEFAIEQSSTTFIVILTAYAILLHKLSQQDIVVIGVPLSNRRNEYFKDTFGCFVNILPIAIDFAKDPTCFEIKNQIRQKLLFAHRKQEVSFLDILNSAHGKRNLSYNPYFQTGFTFEPPMNIELNNIKAENIPVEKEGSQLDLFLTMWEGQKQFSGYIEYASDLFLSGTVERFKECFIESVKQVIEKDKKVSQISILPESDKEKLQKWNHTEFDVNTNICLHQKFEEQVKLFPDNIAISDVTRQLTYNDSNIHANRLAHFLIDKGVNIEDIVGVCVERSIELIIAVYAIHKAGGAYLPFDPNYPSERLEMIIDDACPKLIITTHKNSQNLKKNAKIVFIDNILESPLSEKDTNPNLNLSSKNLAYLMYTSGSTGKPKGVMIEHRSVINKLEWMQFQHPLDKTDTLMLKTPVTFDVSVWELFWWYFNGARLTLLPVNGEKDPKTIAEIVESKKVTTIIFVPSMFSPFVEYIKSKQLVSKLNSLRFIIQIGEALSPRLVTNFNNLRNSHFSPLLVNTYGPTEATVAVTYFNCPESKEVNKIYIGKPIFNTKLFVIDDHNLISPIGIPGELVIAGTNLSRGYLNRPDLNKEKFINIKDLNGKNIRVYRTGDLVKWNNEGELDFIGRLDNQVKIRGYRIELGDIEAKLLEHKDIKTATVIVNNNNPESQLSGYIVLNDHANISTDEIKKFLFSKLPDYMIPAQLLIIEKMPLNTSGKIDRKSLPKFEVVLENELIEPKTKFEKELTKIWCRLLNLDVIGVNNNFFDIGGNSLITIRMVSEIKDILMIDIEPLIVMQYPNIRELAVFLSKPGDSNDEQDKINIRSRKRDFSKFRNKLN
jgi:amino acid adenylation domain-containing protein